MRFIGAFILWIAIFIVAGAIFIWSGAYDVAADTQHWPATRYLVGALREHSIAQRSHGVAVPNLDNAAMVKEGAEHYAEMCSGCHLAPGMDDSEIRHGLNPRPPNLTRFAPDPAEAFWIIKHGIRMTGMPAWGPTHDDNKIWAMVAYLQKQPKMGADEYRQLTADAAHEHEHGMEGETQMPMPATSPPVPAPAASTPPSPASSAH
ncbi:MAG TPA: c-type cytochrome [Rhodanobacteraceae bacterium]|nr:c-type cytochrome [Rhodanobacteraceae bacterium]